MSHVQQAPCTQLAQQLEDKIEVVHQDVEGLRLQVTQLQQQINALQMALGPVLTVMQAIQVNLESKSDNSSAD